MNEQLQQIIDKYSNIKENFEADLNEIFGQAETAINTAKELPKSE